MWDNHLGPEAPYGAESIEFSLRKADRDLRLADRTEELPPFLRSVLGIDPLEQTIATSVISLEEVLRGSHTHAPSEALEARRREAAFALGVLSALDADGNPAAYAFPQLGLEAAPAAEPVLSRIIEGQEHWWDLAYLRALEVPEAGVAARLVDARSDQLTRGALKARGTVAALTLGALLFVPGTLIAFLRTPRAASASYPQNWTLSFGLGVFLLAYLAHVGFNVGFNTVLQQLALIPTDDPGRPLIPMPLFIVLDAATRFLPALIAIGLMFRRSRHAIRSFGLAGPLNGRIVLGSFAILQVLDFGLRLTLDRSNAPDPLGGLSAVEDGPWGLVFGIVSACLAAPLAEEILYRGVLFRSLANRLRLPLAVAISSLVFALVHFYPLSSLLLVTAVGATCALSYAASGTLLTAVVLHALYNAAIKIPEWIVYHTPLS